MSIRISPSYKEPIYHGRSQNPQVGDRGNLNGQLEVYPQAEEPQAEEPQAEEQGSFTPQRENNNCFTRFCVAIMNLCCQCCKKPDSQTPSLEDRAAPISNNDNNSTVLTILSNHGLVSPVQEDGKRDEDEVHFYIDEEKNLSSKSVDNSQLQNESIDARHDWIGTYDPIFNPRRAPKNSTSKKNPRLDSPRPSFSGPSRNKTSVENEVINV